MYGSYVIQCQGQHDSPTTKTRDNSSEATRSWRTYTHAAGTHRTRWCPPPIRPIERHPDKNGWYPRGIGSVLPQYLDTIFVLFLDHFYLLHDLWKVKYHTKKCKIKPWKNKHPPGTYWSESIVLESPRLHILRREVLYTRNRLSCKYTSIIFTLNLRSLYVADLANLYTLYYARI